MLVSRRVQHDVRPVRGKDLFQFVPVADVGNLHHEIQISAIPDFQFLLNIIRAIFIDIQDNQPPGRNPGNLPGQLAANAASAARYQDGFSFIP